VNSAGRLFLPVVLPIRHFGGHESMLVEWLGAAMRERGLDPVVYCADNAPLRKACADAGIPVQVVLGGESASRTMRPRRLAEFRETLRVLRSLPPGVPVLFAPGLVQSAPQHILAAILLGRRVVAYVAMAFPSRELGLPWARLRDRVAGRIASRVSLWITITHEQRDLLRGTWHIAAPILVVPNRLELLSSSPRPLPSGPGRTADPLQARFVGRFVRHQKGLDWLVSVLEDSGARHSWLRVAFQGGGDFEPELRALARREGAVPVEIVAWSPMEAGLAQTDVLLLASRYEGLPLVAIEATHLGIPVVATRQAGLGEILPPTCLYDFGDAAGLLAALSAMRDPARRGEAVRHARERIDRILSREAFDAAIAQVVVALGPPRLRDAGKTPARDPSLPA